MVVFPPAFFRPLSVCSTARRGGKRRRCSCRVSGLTFSVLFVVPTIASAAPRSSGLSFQEVKFKSYYHDLHWALTEYDRVVTEVIM